MNELTGRKPNSKSPFPPEEVIAMTILAGEAPCINCGEAINRATGRVVCPPCSKVFDKLTGRETEQAFRYRDRRPAPEWFIRVLYFGDMALHRKMPDEEITADGRISVRKRGGSKWSCLNHTGPPPPWQADYGFSLDSPGTV